MKNTFTSTNQFWTEIATSSGLAGVLATPSSCLTTWEAARMQFIADFAAANSFLRPHMLNELEVALDKVLRRFPATTD